MKYCCSARPTAGPFDFHTHTCYSDGAPDQTPRTVCRLAKTEGGLAHLALTDHDWMLPRAEREALMDEFGLDVIPACELSAELVLDGRRHIIHIGGHWLSEEDPGLQEILRHNQAQDHESYVKEMLRLCLRCGLDPSREGVERSYQMILERNPHSHHLGKQAVTTLLCETGCVSSPQEAREKYLSAHGERLAYVPGEAFFHFAPFDMVLEAVNRTGLSTLNHLYYYRLERAEEDALVALFHRLGGQALETLYTGYSPAQQARLAGYCQAFGLLPNCGSDRHTGNQSFLAGPPALFQALRDRCLTLHGAQEDSPAQRS